MSWGDIYIRLGKIKTSGNQRSAQSMQILNIAFPPRILPKNEAISTNGNKSNMIATNQKNA
jgi:hypothetical protein